MEVMTANRNKRTILLIQENHEASSALYNLLTDIYHFIIITALEEGLSAVRRMSDNLSAVLIDSELPGEGCKIFLQKISRNKKWQTLPVLVLTSEETMHLKQDYLSLGAVDFITSPYHKKIIINRISNAVRLKDSASFPELEKMLRALPANIYLKDAEGKYIFATHYWHHLEHDDDPDWTIRGKTDIDIRKDKENAILAYQSDLQLLADGKERSYVIEVNADDILEYLQITKAPVRDENNEITGIIALINNVTEQELLKQKLERQAYRDPMTGLYNRSYYEKYIRELPADCYPLTIISADCNDLKYINDYYGHLAGDEYIRISASLFLYAVGEKKLIFRVGGDEFLIFLPQTSEKKAQGIIESLRRMEKTYSIGGRQISISYGAAVMPDSTHSLLDCIRKADKNMYQDKKQHKNQRN